MSHEKVRNQFAVKTITFMLSCNEYRFLEGDAADIMARADIFVPNTVPENRGETFAVNAHWVEDDTTAILLGEALGQKRLAKEDAKPFQTYNAIVIGKGYRLLVSAELKSKLLYDEKRYTVVETSF